MEKKIFGSRLRELRKQKNMSQAELGHLLGVSPTQVGDIERGNSTTSMPRLYELCQFFNVSSDYLLGLTDVQTPYPRKAASLQEEAPIDGSVPLTGRQPE